MKAIAYTGALVPPEWIAAHGLQPRYVPIGAEVDRPPAVPSRGVCPYAHALLDEATGGSDASALVVTTACDQQRYAAAWIAQRGRRPAFLMNVPSTWQTPTARQLYRDEILRLGRFLVEQGGRQPSQEQLAGVIRDYAAARAALHAGRSRLSARRFADAILALRHGNTAAAVGNAAVEQPAEEIRAEEIQPGGIPLALVGGPLMPKDFAVFDVIERAGGRVVLNATETGERTLGGPIDPRALAEEPLEAMMRLYFDGVAEIFQRPNSRLYEWLGRELAARGVRGLLLRRYLWCDMWHAEFPRLKRWSPVPVLELDVCDDDRSAAGRTAGRIEAFLEMLAGTAAARTP